MAEGFKDRRKMFEQMTKEKSSTPTPSLAPKPSTKPRYMQNIAANNSTTNTGTTNDTKSPPLASKPTRFQKNTIENSQEKHLENTSRTANRFNRTPVQTGEKPNINVSKKPSSGVKPAYLQGRSNVSNTTKEHIKTLNNSPKSNKLIQPKEDKVIKNSEEKSISKDEPEICDLNKTNSKVNAPTSKVIHEKSEGYQEKDEQENNDLNKSKESFNIQTAEQGAQEQGLSRGIDKDENNTLDKSEIPVYLNQTTVINHQSEEEQGEELVVSNTEEECTEDEENTVNEYLNETQIETEIVSQQSDQEKPNDKIMDNTVVESESTNNNSPVIIHSRPNKNKNNTKKPTFKNWVTNDPDTTSTIPPTVPSLPTSMLNPQDRTIGKENEKVTKVPAQSLDTKNNASISTVTKHTDSDTIYDSDDNLEEEPWYSSVSKEESSRIMKNTSKGNYLVRPSNNNTYVLMVRISNATIKKFKISTFQGGWVLGEVYSSKKIHGSIGSLMKYYLKNGIKCGDSVFTLKNPAKCNTKQ